MMELEDQVCSLEMAKRLKELGVKQETFFYWNYNVDLKSQVLLRHDQIFHNEQDYDGLAKEEYPTQSFSAFTVVELGEMLPGDDTVASRKLNSSWRSILYDFRGLNHYFTQAKTEANARAKMLIYLLEKGLVKP